MRQSDSDLGLIVAPTLSMRLRTAVHLFFRLVIWAGNKRMPALRHRNVAGQEVRDPCLQRVLVRLNGDCHKEIDPCLVGAEEGPHPRGRLTLRLLSSQYTAAIAA